MRNKPLYKRIADDVRAAVTAGRYADGKLPSDSQFERRYKTTRQTVVKAMQTLEADGVIIRRSGIGSFVATQDDLPQGQYVSTLIAPGDEFFERVSGYVGAACRTYGLNLIWGPDADFRSILPHASIAHLVEQYKRQNVRGVFFAPAAGNDATAARNKDVADALTRAGIKIVLLCRDNAVFPLRSGYDLVGVDNLEAGYRQTMHLVEEGCKRIVYIMRDDLIWTMRARVTGYHLALQAAGLPALPVQSAAVNAWNEKFMGAVMARYKPDGFVCFNDALAARVLNALASINVAVPARVKVIGVDDSDYARYLAVPLTTLRQPLASIGEEAARLMSLRLGNDTTPPRRILFDTELVKRASTGRVSKGRPKALHSNKKTSKKG